jgi:hypothetical protein
VDRHAIELGVGGHHRPESGEPDGRFEGTGVDVVELARPDGGGGHVLPGVGHRVAEEVLGAGQHALAQVFSLHAAREGDAHGGDEVRILAVGLVDSAPAGIAGDVHDGRQRAEQTHGAHLAPHDVRHLLHGIGVPRRRQPDRGGKVRKAARHHAVQSLVVEDRRDPEAGLGD